MNMSASPIARQAVESKSIPIKRVMFNDLSELPSHYSSTPGGTLFSTTPGGSRIVYEKSVLLNLRNSPISKTPPSFEIPDSISNKTDSPKKVNKPHPKGRTNGFRRPSKSEDHVADDQFQIEL